MKLLYWIGFLILLSSCAKEDINGHWHIHSVLENETKETYLTFDIINNTEVIVGRHSFYPESKGTLNTWKKTIEVPGECGSGRFNYQLVNNTLLLDQFVLEGTYKGERCDTACCTIWKDYFQNIPLEINLPVKTNQGIYKEYQKTLSANIFMGTPKEQYWEYHGTDPRMILEDDYAQLEDIGSWIQVVKTRFPNQEHHRIKFIIFADKAVNSEMIISVAKELQKHQIKHIYLAYLDTDSITQGNTPFKVKSYKES